jgi:hypothetical protein
VTETHVPRDVLARYLSINGQQQDRQARAAQVSAARRGEVNTVMPGTFPSNWPKPVVANILDTTARDLAEVLARIPAVDCTSSSLTTDKSKKFSSKRTKIALYYVEHSRLKLQLYRGADWFFSFAAMPIVVEPDFETNCPRFRIDDPRGAYWELDFYGNTKIYAKSWQDTIDSLAAKFPEVESLIRGPQDKDGFGVSNGQSGDTKLDVAQVYIGNKIFLFLPERQGLLLRQIEHRLNRPPVIIAERPKWDEQGRGQFDDVMWVWLARARMAVYGLEAADKAVRAPLAVPDDVTQISFGADALIRTNSPDKVRRVPIELPQSSLIEAQVLDKEIADGSRVPAARRGDVNASVITGRGVDALTEIYSTQIATAQDILGDALRRCIAVAFEMDETYWPDDRKTVTGVASGAPYTETYTPAKDIAGDYTVSVTYGMTAGMDPNRAIVFLLQLRADQAIDRDTMQRMLPFEVDVEQLQRRIDVEQLTDAMKQGIFGLLANAPAMGAQGIDPLQTMRRATQIARAREGGTSFLEAVEHAFEPTPEEQAAAQGAQQDPMAQLQALAGGGGAPGGGGQQQPGDNSYMGAGAAPDVSMVLAGLTNGGKANLQANVSRRLPA